MGSLIYTRGGDGGETSLVDGSRLPKDAPRVEAYGEVDELNSWVGLARARVPETFPPLLGGVLEFLQAKLYNCSSNLASPPGAALRPPGSRAEDVTHLERFIDRFEEETGAIGFFILPVGTELASTLHVARTVCRRAERRIVTLSMTERVDPGVLRFINRASDLLFAAARYANRMAGREDESWEKDRRVVPLP